MDEMKKFGEKLDEIFSILLTCEAGWGDDDRNVPFSPSFLEAIKDPILKVSRLITERGFGLPSIGPLNDNSIDAYWKNDKFGLLVNIGEYNDGLGASLHGFTVINGVSIAGRNDVEWAGELGKELVIIKDWLETILD